MKLERIGICFRTMILRSYPSMTRIASIQVIPGCRVELEYVWFLVHWITLKWVYDHVIPTTPLGMMQVCKWFVISCYPCSIWNWGHSTHNCCISTSGTDPQVTIHTQKAYCIAWWQYPIVSMTVFPQYGWLYTSISHPCLGWPGLVCAKSQRGTQRDETDDESYYWAVVNYIFL